MEIHKLTGFMGAEVSGVDLKTPVAANLAAALNTALADHHMIVFRGQYLTIEEQKRLTLTFGPLMRLPYVVPMDDDPDVIAVRKLAEEVKTGVFGGDWHSDFSFLENPPAGSIMNAVDVPDVGGDTVWSSQAAAYDALPANLKRIVDGRKAVHTGKPYGVAHAPPEDERANTSIRMTRGNPNADREILHPAVVTNPLNGQKALFLNPIYTTRFDGMTEEESRPLLDAIYRYATRPDFCCRLRWRNGDVAVWDNRMCLHFATNDYDGVNRLLYRTTFAAEPPR
ncbi:MAG: TauD/TfdA family dioxygenase [Alphaproteobacteria bacterium]